MSDPNSTYYEKGSVEEARETPLTVRKLETRRRLTRTSDRLVIALVGLPGRGKSFVARKLQSFLTWRGTECKVFNVGKYRRQAHAELTRSRGNSIASENEYDPQTKEKRETIGACDANFFDANNAAAAALREHVAAVAMRDMLKWLDQEDEGEPNGNGTSNGTTGKPTTNPALHGLCSGRPKLKERVAIFDATNSTIKRRKWILQECTSPAKRAGKPTGVVFVESICDDEELLEENFRFKAENSPDFQGMSTEEAIADLKNRVRKYEEQYETLQDDHQSYIKIYNLSSKLMVNHIYGRMAKTIVPSLMAWNIGTRPIFICRPGETNEPNPGSNADREYWKRGPNQITRLPPRRSTALRGENLGVNGRRFRDALCDFIDKEGTEFMKKRVDAFAYSLETGTSVNGLISGEAGVDGSMLPFPCFVMTSTMPRAVQTATWEALPFNVHELSSLNPLDKGDFNGMELEEIQEEDPAWYESLESDPFRTRFPGGECYGDLISRLESCIIDMEQQVKPVLVISHISTIQVLLAYFRNSPVEECASIEVPLHTVIKFTPARGGGWKETRHRLIEDEPNSYKSSESDICSSLEDIKVSTTPIWGDHRKKLAKNHSSVSSKSDSSSNVV